MWGFRSRAACTDPRRSSFPLPPAPSGYPLFRRLIVLLMFVVCGFDVPSDVDGGCVTHGPRPGNLFGSVTYDDD